MAEVSVIIPVYNVEQWLPACLDSVLAQTLSDIEVICVDDCSPDGCAAILADYESCDPRIRVITLTENSGQGVARNVGFEASSGRYAYFLDSDDMVAPQALEELVKRADADQLDGIFFDSMVIYDSPELAKRYKSYPACHSGTYPPSVMEGLELFEAFTSQHDWTCYVQRQLWRSEYLRTQGIAFPTWASHEDEMFAFEALVSAKRVAFVPEPYFLRRYREGSVMTTKPTLRSFMSYFQALCQLTRFVHDHDLRTEYTNQNIARISDAVWREHSALIEAGIDIEAQFDGSELLGEYLAFAAMQRRPRYLNALSPSQLEIIRSAERIYIFGAGVNAVKVFEYLSALDIAVEGFLVTEIKDNASVLKGHHVRAAAEAPLDNDALVIVSVTDGYREDVEDLLDGLGWRHVYFKDGWNSWTSY